MTKDELRLKILHYKQGVINKKDINAAVDAYTSALLQQCNVSLSLPPLDDEIAATPICDALYATGKFTTDDCDSLADGILQYIKDAGFRIVGGNAS